MNRKDGMIHNPPLPRNYAPDFLVLEKGHGVYVEDSAGNVYLDFGSGIAVNALGYGRDDLARVAADQMKKLVHVSNLYTTKPTIELAERLTASGPFEAVHFGSSGTEANEAALKYARLYAHRTRGAGHHKLLCFQNAFHGRTLGALSVTPNEHYQEPYQPLLDGVEVLPYNDVEALERTLDASFAGVIVEVIQGEGGLQMMRKEFAAALNRACKKHDVMLIADEVQTGLGRTGTLFASTHVGLQPDIVTLAKPLAGGLPLSATLIPAKINKLLKPGDHGTTFGGGPVTTAVALHIWDFIHRPGFFKEVQHKGSLLKAGLDRIRGRFSKLGPVRGEGLLRGLPLAVDRDREASLIADVIAEARAEGMLILRCGSNVVRIAPPLIITPDEIDKGISILESVLEKHTTELE